jgi:uncharacterized protein YchJ
MTGQDNHAIVALRRNLRSKYQGHADLQVIHMMLHSKLDSLIMADIDAVIETWTPTQLADAIQANVEAEQLEAASEGHEH